MRKQGSRFKRILCTAGIFLAFLRIAYICAGGEVRKPYEFSGPGEEITQTADVLEIGTEIAQSFRSEKSRLYDLQFLFAGVPQDSQDGLSLQILSESRLLWQGMITLQNLEENVWHKVYVNMPLEAGRVYQMRLMSKGGGYGRTLYVSGGRQD